MPTVAELAHHLAQEHAAQILGGRLGLGRDVARVVRRSPDQPGLPLHDGDVVILQPREWLNQLDFATRQFVGTAAALGVSAVCFESAIDNPTKSAADDRDLPVIGLSQTDTTIDASLNAWLARRQAGEARVGLELGLDLRDLIGAGATEAVLLDHLAYVTRKALVVHEPGGQIQHIYKWGNRNELHEPRVRRALGRIAISPSIDDAAYYVLPELELAVLTTRIASTLPGAGCLSLVAEPSAFTFLDRAALRAFVLACMRTPPQPYVADERPEAELLARLMVGEDAPFEGSAHEPHVGFALRVPPGPAPAVDDLLAPWSATYRGAGDTVVGLVSGRALSDQRVRDRLMHDLAGTSPGAAVGYSAVHTGVRGMREAVLEAQKALRGLAGPNALSYTRMCVERLLQSDGEALFREWQERVLEPLQHHDQFEPPGLIPTLEAFLDNACVTLRTAEVLNCHRNSVIYRLQRVREIVDIDLDDADTRLLLQLVLRAVHLAELRGCATPAATS